MTTLLKRAAKLTNLLLPVAAKEPQDVMTHVESLTDAQVRAVLDYLVRLDRQEQAGEIRITIDHPALDQLGAAADEGPEALRATVLALGRDDVDEAVAQLLLLHVDLDRHEAKTASAAQMN